MKKLFIVSLFMAVVSNNLSAKDVTLVVKKHGQNKYETIVVDESEVEQITKSNMYLAVEKEVWLSRPDTKAKTRPINIEKYEANSKIKSKSAAEGLIAARIIFRPTASSASIWTVVICFASDEPPNAEVSASYDYDYRHHIVLYGFFKFFIS